MWDNKGCAEWKFCRRSLCYIARVLVRNEKKEPKKKKKGKRDTSGCFLLFFSFLFSLFLRCCFLLLLLLLFSMQLFRIFNMRQCLDFVSILRTIIRKGPWHRVN